MSHRAGDEVAKAGVAAPADARPGARVSSRWAAWRARTDLDEYERRWNRMEADGTAPHGEADLVSSFGPARVLDAGCGMGRVAIELAGRGVDVVGVDLDGDLLDVAQRHRPDLTWYLADLAEDAVGGPYDVAVMAGNVMVFCRPEDRAPIVANVARHLTDDGVLVAGFALEPDDGALDLDEYEQACAGAGLVVEHRWSTWAREPLSGGDDYAVVVARRPRDHRAGPTGTPSGAR